MQRGNRNLGKITGHFSPTVSSFAAGYSRVVTLVAKVRTSNPDRTISLKRLQYVVEKKTFCTWLVIFKKLSQAFFKNFALFFCTCRMKASIPGATTHENNTRNCKYSLDAPDDER
jgi:hypothetical protein